MLEKLKNLFANPCGRKSAPDTPVVHKSGAHAAPEPRLRQVRRRNAEFVNADEDLSGKVESAGPGKNVLIRNKYVREDTGTHEMLKILDDSIVDLGEERGIDPYNTGGFDRSRNWDKRFGK